MPAGFDGYDAIAEPDLDLRIRRQELGRDLDDGTFGHTDLQVFQKHSGEEFIDQNAVMLGIVAELYHVPVTVVRLQQMGLGASSHFSHQPDGVERHSKMICRRHPSDARPGLG